jgi:hypothetical protein
MELALPILALGGLYVISNQKQQKQQQQHKQPKPIENFENLKQQKQYLPNTQNYPILKTQEDDVQSYPNPNAATDKYFNQNYYEKNLPKDKNIPQIYSLTGDYLENEQFKHNNMVPFVGGKIQSYTYKNDISESILDNMTGTGSQIIKKIEQAPLFKPQDNIQWAYGTPNNSDFYQSRVNPGTISNNVKPFESVNVGPGLNQGFTSGGSNGFNSGMEARDTWLPKTVDEMRVDTNPKLEFMLNNLEGPAGSLVKNVGMIGKVEKQKPDTFYFNTQDRWLTTTGAEKGETLRPIQEMGIIRRNNVATNYTGPAGSLEGQAGYTPIQYEKSRRNELGAIEPTHCNATGSRPIDDGNKFLKSHTNYSNHRSTVAQLDTLRGGFGGAIGAVIAPFMDLLRPSRKEECISNVRVYGEAGSSVPKNYVINPKDVTNTTIKETTLYSPNFNINNQKEGVYVNNYAPTDLTQRDTTSCSQVGNVGRQNSTMLYDGVYSQHNNDIKSATIENRANQGGTQIFNQQMNVNIARQDTDRYNNRLFTPSSVINRPPMKENYGKIKGHQNYDENKIGCERIQGELLNAFRNNPYTHSLTTSV